MNARALAKLARLHEQLAETYRELAAEENGDKPVRVARRTPRLPASADPVLVQKAIEELERKGYRKTGT